MQLFQFGALVPVRFYCEWSKKVRPTLFDAFSNLSHEHVAAFLYNVVHGRCCGCWRSVTEKCASAFKKGALYISQLPRVVIRLYWLRLQQKAFRSVTKSRGTWTQGGSAHCFGTEKCFYSAQTISHIGDTQQLRLYTFPLYHPFNIFPWKGLISWILHFYVHSTV